MVYQGKAFAAAQSSPNLPVQTTAHTGDQCKLRKKTSKPSKTTGAKAERENAHVRSLKIVYIGKEP